MYKIVHSLAPGHITDLFCKHEIVRRHRTRSAESGNIFIPQRNLKLGQEAITFLGDKTWNDIPCDIKRTQSLDAFKGTLKKFLLCNVSVNSNWVHPPGQPPGISSKTLPGGSGFDF